LYIRIPANIRQLSFGRTFASFLYAELVLKHAGGEVSMSTIIVMSFLAVTFSLD
jgi:hypothetical protein